MNRHVYNEVLKDVVWNLRSNQRLEGIQIVAQNDQDLASLIQTEEGKTEGVVVVVSVDTVEKIHSNPAKYRISFSANVTEFVPVNRESPDFKTAIDIADECGETIEESGNGSYNTLRHSTPGDGILNAVAECSVECHWTE